MAKDPNYWNDKYWPRVLGRRLSRRRIIQLSAMGTLGAMAAAYLGCGGGKEKPAPAATPGVTPTAGATPQPSPAAASPLNEIFGPGGSKAGQGLTFKAGALLPITGPGSYYGQFQGNGVKFGVKQIKEAGGPDIQLIIKDHKSGDTTAGVTAARELATSDKVPFIFSSYAGVLFSIFPVIQEFHVLTLDGGGGTSELGKKQDFFWGTRMLTPEDPYKGVLDYAKQKFPNAKRVASVGWDVGPANEPVIALLKQALADHGMELVADERTVIGATDYSTTLARVKGTNPDLILTGLWGLDPGNFMKQYVTTGMTAQVVGSEFTSDAAKLAGDAYDRYWFAYDFFDPNNPTNPWAKFFVDTYRKEYGIDPDFYSANYYEKAFILWELIKRVLAKGGDLSSGTALQDVLKENLTFKSVYGGDAKTVGTLELDPESHAVKRKEMVIGIVKSGKPQVVAKIDKDKGLLQTSG